MHKQCPVTPGPWDKSPLHLAIEFIEEQLSTQGRAVLRSMIQQQARRQLDEGALPFVDHSLKVLIHAGYVRRCHMATGVLAYQPTPRWSGRSELLAQLKSPQYVKRFRPRNAEYRRAMALGLPYPKPANFEQGGDLRTRKRLDERQQSLIFDVK